MKSITQEDISSVLGPCDSDYLKSNKGIEQWICGSEKVEHERSMETNVKIKPKYCNCFQIWLWKSDVIVQNFSGIKVTLQAALIWKNMMEKNLKKVT